MSSTIDGRPSAPGPDDPTGHIPSGPGPYPGATHAFAPGPGYPPPYGAGPPPPYGQGGPPQPGPWQSGPWQPGPPTYPAYPPPRSRTPWGWIVFGVVGALLVVVTLGVVLAVNRPMTVPGSVTLTDQNSRLTPGARCEGSGATWSWLDVGTPVTIYDSSGAVVGTTSLGYGTSTGGSSSYGYATSCVFPFTLTDVPSGDDFYRVKIGSNAGDGVTFTGQQLRDNGAQVLYNAN